ncbi:MAG: hypothetical protein D6732_07470 [Methanobacteriota archaeon]|nr:MAG: hypothetical protein D6732_07470 [Euryarchaeota archaeon]
MKRIVILATLLIFASAIAPTIAEESAKNGLFPTDKGSSVAVNVTLTHDGLVNGVPTMQVNKTYHLNVTLKVEALGQDVQDIHDITVTTSMTKTNVLQKTTYYHSGIYVDTESTLKAGDTWYATIEIVPLGPAETVEGVTLSVVVSLKENVKLNLDPKTEFNPFNYEIILNPDGNTFTITDFADGVKVNRSVVTFLSKESQVNFTIVFGAEEINNETEKPVVRSNVKYSLYFYLKVLKLGPDAEDVHDIEISLLMVDESLTDILPNSDSKYYFAMTLATDAKLGEGDSIERSSMLYISSNVQDTNPKLKVNVKAKEGVPNFIDPTSTIADFNIELHLNPKEKTTDTVGAPIQYTFLPILAMIALIQRRRRI